MPEIDHQHSRTSSIIPFPSCVPRTADLPSKTLFAAEIDCAAGSVNWTPPRWETPTVEEVAALLPEFQILGLLGRGGMGAVYKAVQLKEKRVVAVKLLPPAISADPGFRRRFLREAQTLAHLDHSGVAALYEMGVAEETHLFLVMEYVEGKNLHELIETRAITPEQARKIMCDLCEALVYVHQQGVVHRDINPSNVIVGGQGCAKLVDFGIARWTPSGIIKLAQTTKVLFGTRDYVAPEQLENKSVDHRADIYAMGVLLYELLCFRLPRGHFPLPSELVGADSRFDAIVCKALHTNPDLRYQTAAAMRLDLENARFVSLDAINTKPLPEKPKRGKAVLSAAVAFVLIGIGTWSFLNRNPVVQPDAGVKPVPLESKQQAVPVASAEQIQWHDWLAEHGPEIKGLEKSQDGYTPIGADFSPVLSPSLKNQAVRVTYRISGGKRLPNLRLYVRAAEDLEEYYGLFNFKAIWQLARQHRGQQPGALATEPKPEGFSDDEIQIVEVRAVGNQLIFSHNGQTKLRRTDNRFGEGHISIRVSPGITLKSIEWAELK